MTYEIASNVCEICHEQAKVAMSDQSNNLHYACANTQHITKIWDNIGKP